MPQRLPISNPKCVSKAHGITMATRFLCTVEATGVRMQLHHPAVTANTQRCTRQAPIDIKVKEPTMFILLGFSCSTFMFGVHYTRLRSQ